MVQETRGWDDAKQKTFVQRSKENADDYRYMPDPDLPPVIIDEQYVQAIHAEMPVMPAQWRQRLSSLGLDKAHIETLLDAELDDERVSYLPLIELQLEQPELARFLANWFVNLEIPLRREGKIKNVLKDVERAEIYAAIQALLTADKLSSSRAKDLLVELLENDVVPENIEDYAAQNGYLQVSDEAEIAKIVEQVIKDNSQAAADIQAGEMKAIGFLVGQVMKVSQGKANPQLAQELIKALLK